MRSLWFLLTFLALLVPGLASAHIIPLDVTVSRVGQQVQASVHSPDGIRVSGVRLFVQLGGGTPRPFTETVAGTYMAAVGRAAPSGPVTLLDRTFPQEGSQASATLSWPPQQPVTLRLPARPVVRPPAGLTPSLLIAVGLSLLAAALSWRFLRTAGALKPDPDGTPEKGE